MPSTSTSALRRRSHKFANEATGWLRLARTLRGGGRAATTTGVDLAVSQAVVMARRLWQIALLYRRQARWQEAHYQQRRRTAQGVVP